jgi:hypothetical protein
MNMNVVKQFSVFLVNKPGVLAQVCQVLADQKINIKALTLVDSQEHGVLRLVVEDGDVAARVLGSLNVPVTEADVLCIEMDNRPGAMADVCNRLATAHININYAYCTSGARGGKTTGVFKIADLKKAQKVLAQRKPLRKAALVKRSPATKR